MTQAELILRHRTPSGILACFQRRDFSQSHVCGVASMLSMTIRGYLLHPTSLIMHLGIYSVSPLPFCSSATRVFVLRRVMLAYCCNSSGTKHILSSIPEMDKGAPIEFGQLIHCKAADFYHKGRGCTGIAEIADSGVRD